MQPRAWRDGRAYSAPPGGNQETLGRAKHSHAGEEGRHYSGGFLGVPWPGGAAESRKALDESGKVRLQSGRRAIRCWWYVWSRQRLLGPPQAYIEKGAMALTRMWKARFIVTQLLNRSALRPLYMSLQPAARRASLCVPVPPLSPPSPPALRQGASLARLPD